MKEDKVERFNFTEEKWVFTSENLEQLYRSSNKKIHPSRFHKMNQESFNKKTLDDQDNIYFYREDCMGHMSIYRMREDSFRRDWDLIYFDMVEDYTVEHKGKDHIICGVCNRCKTCKYCACEEHK